MDSRIILAKLNSQRGRIEFKFWNADLFHWTNVRLADEIHKLELILSGQNRSSTAVVVSESEAPVK